MHKDDTLYQEAYEKMLDSWMSFLTESRDMREGALSQPATDIFNSYLQCHISSPDGTRNQVGNDNNILF